MGGRAHDDDIYRVAMMAYRIALCLKLSVLFVQPDVNLIVGMAAT